ncbi:MAG TPA: hypothetical protein VME69_00480 [Methylocella sp.]|nr:hypothetical protein [Methylocella sp.]
MLDEIEEASASTTEVKQIELALIATDKDFLEQRERLHADRIGRPAIHIRQSSCKRSAISSWKRWASDRSIGCGGGGLWEPVLIVEGSRFEGSRHSASQGFS